MAQRTPTSWAGGMLAHRSRTIARQGTSPGATAYVARVGLVVLFTVTGHSATAVGVVPGRFGRNYAMLPFSGGSVGGEQLST